MPETTLTDGSPVTPDHREIDPKTGRQKGYVVLSEAERAKGFILPVRKTYIHLGIRPKHRMRALTDDEKDRYGDQFVLYETYPPELGPKVGKLWTAVELASGCGKSTTMGNALAETYARDPKFYGATFCVHCAAHFPVDQFIWAGTTERVGS